MSVSKCLKWILLILLVQSIWILESEGATYNFYINNTENGAPAVTLKDGDDKNIPVPIPETPEVTPQPEPPLPLPPAPELTASVPKSEPVAFHPWRLGVQMTSVNLMALKAREASYSYRGSYSSSYSEKERYESVLSKSSFLLSASYFLNPYIGVTGLVGAINGAEAEINLLPSYSPLQLSFMAGFGKPKLTEGALNSFLFGFQGGLDFLDQYGLQVSWRRFSSKWVGMPVNALGFGAYMKF